MVNCRVIARLFQRISRASIGPLRRPIVPVLALMLWPSSTLADGGELVTIEGGYSGEGKQYTWTITNRRESALTFVQFPHYLARLFLAPDGWSTDSTNLVKAGIREQAGTCTAVANSPEEGILPGGSATFVMRVAGRRAVRRLGAVRVQFADGVESTIDRVEVPGRELMGDKYLSLIGLGVIFVVWLVVGKLRGRPAKT